MFDVGRHSFCLHQLWKAGSGPVKDIINIGENPQFSLEVCLVFDNMFFNCWYVFSLSFLYLYQNVFSFYRIRI
jgi:hypothetical protein